MIFLSSAQASIVDQSQEQFDGSWLVICSEWSFAQTFTTGISSQLEKVDLYLDNIFCPSSPGSSTIANYPSTVSIVNVIDSIPSGSVLGQVYVDGFSVAFNSIDFSSESVFLTAGTQYGIVLSNDDPEPYDDTSTQWRCKSTDVYSGGSLWVWMADVGWTQSVKPPYESMPVETYYDKDAAFITYMVPEPSSALLFSLGSLAILRMHRSQLSRAPHR